MFNDFLNLNYWKTNNKLAKIRELINRIDMQSILDEMDAITLRIYSIDPVIEQLPPNPERQPPDEPKPTPPSPEPELLPDLVINSITSTEHTNYIDFEITVKNIGKASSSACSLEAYIDSSVLLVIPALEIGQSAIVNHQYSFDPSSTETVNRTLLVDVDPNNTIEESNEGNNNKSYTFESKGAYVIGGGNGGIIVHVHNGEGKEINSILFPLGTDFAQVYSTPSLSFTVPMNEATHGIVSPASAGQYTVSATFNNITIEKEITVESGKVNEVFFVFNNRIEHVPSFEAYQSASVSGSFTGDGLHTDLDIDFENPFTLLASMRVINLGAGNSCSYNLSADTSLTPTHLDASLLYTVSGDNPVSYRNEVNIDFHHISDSTFLAVNPLPNVTFDKWHIQQVSNGTFATIKYGSGISGYYIIKSNPGYSYFTLMTDLSGEIQGGVSDFELYVSRSPSGMGILKQYGDINHNEQQNISADLTSYIMSSVPYDIEGTAV